MDEGEIAEDFREFGCKVLGILLFGSAVDGFHTSRSDIDVCLVAGDYDVDRLFRELLKTKLTEKYDVKIFELLPLKMKGSVLDDHRVVWAADEPELSYYLYRWRRLWSDQKIGLGKLGLRVFQAG